MGKLFAQNGFLRTLSGLLIFEIENDIQYQCMCVCVDKANNFNRFQMSIGPI